jgi:hypothetical protein
MLLRPSPQLNEIVLGVLGRAQSLYPVELHAFVFLSNHYHLLLTPADARQLAQFMQHLNTNLSKEVGRLHDWRGTLFERRYQSIVVTDEEAAQVARLEYCLANGCKEDLVASPREWPGVSAVRALLGKEELVGTWFDRTTEWRARQCTKKAMDASITTQYPVRLSPLPCWRHLPAQSVRDNVEEIVQRIEAEAQVRLSRTGKSPLGAPAICKQAPHQRPARLQWRPAPLVHAATQLARRAFLEAYRCFVLAYREAAERLRSGWPMPEFPEGSFPPTGVFVRAAVST